MKINPSPNYDFTYELTALNFNHISLFVRPSPSDKDGHEKISYLDGNKIQSVGIL